MRFSKKHKLILSLGLFASLISPLCYAIDKIIVNGLFKNKAIVTIDGKQRVLKAGKPSPEGVLLIEANSKEALIEIDGEQKTYTVGSSQVGGNYKKPSGGKKIMLTPDASGGYSVSGSINGSTVSFIVDTGATLVSMNSNIAKKLGIDYKIIGKESVAYTASGKDKIFIVNLKKVRIGEIELQNIKGAVHEGNFPVITLLGMSFLEKLNMKREGRVLELEKKY